MDSKGASRTASSVHPEDAAVESPLVKIRLIQEVNFGASAEQRLNGMRDMVLRPPSTSDLHISQESSTENGTFNVIVLPEMWPVGFFNFSKYREFANKHFMRFESLIKYVSSSLNCWVFGGSAPYRSGGSYYNRSVIVSPDGDTHYFDKLHLFPYKSQEADILTRGTQLVAFDSPLGKTGILTCFDLRFPEAFRTLRQQNCEAYVVVAAWPKPRLRHWKALLIARAIENQAWVIGVNGHGLDFGTELGGGSTIVAPDGTVVLELADEPQSQLVEFSPGLPGKLRGEFPFNDSTLPHLLGSASTFPIAKSAPR